MYSSLPLQWPQYVGNYNIMAARAVYRELVYIGIYGKRRVFGLFGLWQQFLNFLWYPGGPGGI